MRKSNFFALLAVLLVADLAPLPAAILDLSAAPVGRYLMFEAADFSTTCCAGASIWEVSVDASPIPEPSAALMAVVGIGSVGRHRP